jgi:hypothetical protein
LGKVAQGLADDFDDPALSHGFSPRAPDVPGAGLDDILHVFHLRPELRISLKLPSNLTAAEGAEMRDLHLSRMCAREANCFATAFLSVSTP